MPSLLFDNSYARLPEHFYAKVRPAVVPKPKLIRLNEELATELGMEVSWLGSVEGLGMVSGNQLPEGTEPLAQAYAGHQFGGWVPQLGDGRAILLGEIVTPDGERHDLQLKGSGRTPFSRGGDGKAALGPVLREYILSEAMKALGVPTTRALAAVSTGELVRREAPLPGAILTRVAESHIRVGTFQYFSAQNNTDALRALADHAIARHYPAARESENPHQTFLESVIAAQARLIAQWMHLGFIHGVMNTDNMTVSGETIDYGPCAFIDEFHPEKVFSSIDRNGRYAWNNQPVAAHWNLTRLAEALLPLLSDKPELASEIAQSALGSFSEQFSENHIEGFRVKLGLSRDCDKVEVFTGETLSLLADQKVDFTLFFRHLTKVAADGQVEGLCNLFDSKAQFSTWFARWQNLTGSDKGLADRVEAMRASNPILIPRNHRVEEAIQAGYRGDFDPFHRLVTATARPFEEQPEFTDLEQPPAPHEVVCQTFCGT